MNKACIMKLCWNLNNKPDELWCKVTRNKYQCNTMDDFLQYQKSDSSLWKKIVKTIPQLLSSGSWSIGSGSYIDACNECWVEL